MAWVEGALALVLLAVLQLAGAWISTRIPAFRQILTSEPTVLHRDGRILHTALRDERITEQSLRQAVRSAGIGGLELVAAVVLETNGKLSIIGTSQAGTGTALADLTSSSPPQSTGPSASNDNHPE